MKVVVSQPMYFPWVGLLEQVRFANVFVHYDDVQFARGFFNRVQIKTTNGIHWLTVPTMDCRRGQKINEVKIDNSRDWRKLHRESLRQAYANAPFQKDMLEIVDRVFERHVSTIAEISQFSIMALVDYFELRESMDFFHSSQLSVVGMSSQRLHDITVELGGDVYITGHGAKNYLDHELFEKSGIRVEYIDYKLTPYGQLHGEFTPYVSALDLVANCGKDGKAYICSNSVSWRDFVT